MRTEIAPVTSGQTLAVGFQGVEVGTLRRRTANVSDIEFFYSKEWLGHPLRFPVSVLMPLSEASYGPDIVYPWFLNVLPEGSALTTVGAVLRVDEQDVVAMLEAMGADLPGALTMPLHRPQSKLQPRYHMLTDAELADIIRKLPARPMLVGEDGIHMSLAGAQEKLAVVLDRNGTIGLALDGAPSTHILKPANKHFHSSVANEAFCLRLAEAIGLPASQVHVRKVEDIEYLLVQRYDRRKTPHGIRRLHQEDLCQATATPPYQKYEWNANIGLGGPNIKSCMDALSNTNQPAMNKLRFFEYMLFNVLCGNVDAHAKNYSILFDERVQSVAPLYDVMNGDIYNGVTPNLAMKIAGKQRGDHIHGRHWDRLADENGLSARLVRARVNRLSKGVLDALPRLVDQMQKSAIPSGTYAEIASHISRHCRNMISNLETEPNPDDELDNVDSELDDVPTEDNEPLFISPTRPLI